MRKSLATVATAIVVLATFGATPAVADDGCDRALAATAGTPGHAFVAIHCASPGGTSANPVPASSEVQIGLQGCLAGLQSVHGTPGEPFVRAACTQLASELGVSLPTTNNGEVTPASPGAQSVAQGCGLAIQAVAGTTAEQYVRAGCDQAINSVGMNETPPPASATEATDNGSPGESN